MDNTILLNRVEVEKIVGLSRSSIYRLMTDDEFPLPIKIGPRAVRWPARDIFEWISTRPRANCQARAAKDEAGTPKKSAH